VLTASPTRHSAGHEDPRAAALPDRRTGPAALAPVAGALPGLDPRTARSRSPSRMASSSIRRFLWPVVVAPAVSPRPETATVDLHPLVLVLAVVFAEIADGCIDAKALAMPRVLSAINAALRPLGAGSAARTVASCASSPARVSRRDAASRWAARRCSIGAAAAALGPGDAYHIFAFRVRMFAGLVRGPRRGRSRCGRLTAPSPATSSASCSTCPVWAGLARPRDSIAYRRLGVFHSPSNAPLPAGQRPRSLGWDTGSGSTDSWLIVIAGPPRLAAFRLLPAGPTSARVHFHPTRRQRPAPRDVRVRRPVQGGGPPLHVPPREGLQRGLPPRAADRSGSSAPTGPTRSSRPVTAVRTRAPSSAHACRNTAARIGRETGVQRTIVLVRAPRERCPTPPQRHRAQARISTMAPGTQENPASACQGDVLIPL